MQYRCEATTVTGFVQQLAVNYLGRGYFFYVTGWIPPGKDPHQIDAKLIGRYGINLPKWTRARQKRNQGLAGVQYIRHENFFVLLATEGKHRFFDEEKTIRDARITPITYAGYSMGIRGGRVHVRIAEERFRDLRAYFSELATHRVAETLIREFYELSFEPYGPVKQQMFSILGEVNYARRAAGFARIPKTAIVTVHGPGRSEGVFRPAKWAAIDWVT